MTDTATSTLFHHVFAAFDANDVTTLESSVTEDIELRLGNADPTRGRDAFLDAVNAFHGSVSGVRHEILRVFSEGDVVIIEFDVHYTRRDGGAVTLPCCNVFRLRGALIAEYRSYVDATPVYA